MGKKGVKIGSRIASQGLIFSNPRLVQIGRINKDVYLRFIKLARPDESLTMLMARLADEYKTPRNTPTEICGIKLRRRNKCKSKKV